MFLIAHRGNYKGKNPDKENQEKYVLEAIKKGYNAEVDVWWHEDSFWLGHDRPQYKTSKNFLGDPNIWCHAKNLEVTNKLSALTTIHWFWHETDKITMTSKGYIWTFPGILLENSVINQPRNIVELLKTNSKFAGICADDFTEII